MIRTASVLLVGMTITTGQASAAPYPDRSAGEFRAAAYETVRCYGHNCRGRVYGYRVHGYRSRCTPKIRGICERALVAGGTQRIARAARGGLEIPLA